MSYIGNSPGVASQRIVSPFTATAGQTLFTLSSGYSLGYLDVYLNGAKLIVGTDYTASNGTSVTLTQAAAPNDTVECVAYLPRGLSDGYLKSEADAKYVGLTGDQTIAGVKTFSSAPVMGVTGLTGDIAAARITNALNASGSAPVYACRAWVNFNGTGTVAIRASGNVSSITDLGVGHYQVNMTTAMPDANYSINATTGSNGGAWVTTQANANGYSSIAPTASNFRLQTPEGNFASMQDAPYVNVSVFR